MEASSDFSLVAGGPLYRAYRRAHLCDAPFGLVHRRLLAFLLITWVPPFLLSRFGADRTSVTVSFLGDIDAHARLLVALPLLIIAEPIVHRRIRLVVRQFVSRELVAPVDLPRFVAAVASSVTLINSALLEAAVLVVAFIGGHWFWESQISLPVDTWYATHTVDGTTRLSLAGWWYVLVSLPLFRFLTLRWLVRLTVVWYRFLWLVSRIPLRLNALHPDRTGGLGFLNNSVFAFVPVLAAETALMSALVAERIWHQGATLAEFQGDIVAAVAFLMAVVLLPQTFFTIQLERAWRVGAAEYGAFAADYVDRFRRKWLGVSPGTHESPIGASDIQSLADLANSFEVIRQMSLVPITRNTVLRLGFSIAIPLLPLVLTTFPLDEIVDRAIHMFL